MTAGEFQKQLKKYHKTGEMPVGLAVKLLTECTTDCMYEEETEEAIFMAIQALEQESREITLEDVKGYCKPRCLTIITNELLYELTHPKIKALEQEPILDKIRAEIKGKVLESLSDGGDDWFTAEKVNECLDIIDKYKAESGED